MGTRQGRDAGLWQRQGRQSLREFFDELCDVVVLALQRNIVRKPLHVIGKIGVRFAVLEQYPGNLVAAFTCRQEQRGLVVLILCIDVRVMLDQVTRCLLIVHRRCPVQSCSAYNT